MLGPLIVRGPARDHPVPGGRTSTLLEWLVAHRDTGVAVGRTVDALWPEAAGAEKRAALRGVLSRLRRCLPDPTVVTRMADDRLRLDSDGVEIDVDRFVGDLDLGTEHLAAGRAAASLDDLDRALGWWRGDAYPSLQDSAIGVTESNRLSVRRTDAEVARCAAWIATGQPARARVALEDIVGHDPARESAWRLLMTASAVAGNRVDAARRFQDCRRALAGMGERPDPETVALDRLVLESAPLDVDRLVRREFAGQRHHRSPAVFPDDRGWAGPRVVIAVVDDPTAPVADWAAGVTGDDTTVLALSRTPGGDNPGLESLAVALETADLHGAENHVADVARRLRSWPGPAAADPRSSAARIGCLSALVDTVQAAARHRPLAIVVSAPVATPTLVGVLRQLIDNVDDCPVVVIVVSDPAVARGLITATDDVVDLR